MIHYNQKMINGLLTIDSYSNHYCIELIYILMIIQASFPSLSESLEI